MTVTGSIYFLGTYRPAHFEADSIDALRVQMHAAGRSIEPYALRCWLRDRIKEGAAGIARDSCSAWSADHNDRGISFAKRAHDRFLDRVTAELPPCPGLDYSGAINQQELTNFNTRG